jgi:hypothetical protein
MVYKISDYSQKRAKELNVVIKPSQQKNKKIDVYKGKQKIASIGSITNLDYPTYIKERGKAFADNRRRLYKLRHKNDINNRNGNGFWANKILW